MNNKTFNKNIFVKTLLFTYFIFAFIVCLLANNNTIYVKAEEIAFDVELEDTTCPKCNVYSLFIDYDENGHYLCCDECERVSEIEEHDFEDDVCTICAFYNDTMEFDPDAINQPCPSCDDGTLRLKTDSDQHWLECDNGECDVCSAREDHVFEGDVCDECKYGSSESFSYDEYYVDDTCPICEEGTLQWTYTDETGHYFKCDNGECGACSTKVSHEIDEEECVCGYKEGGNNDDEGDICPHCDGSLTYYYSDKDEHYSYCSTCNEAISTSDHIWNTSTFKCTLCGGCQHPETCISYVAIVGDNTEHNVHCSNCDDNYTEENHTYVSGVCSKCNHICSHPSWDPDTGKCQYCNIECSHSSTTSIEIENDDENHNLKCDTCDKIIGTSKHSYNDGGHCQNCDHDCQHSSWNKTNYECAYCGTDCTHNWSEKDGICTLCSYQCEHDDDEYAQDCGDDDEHDIICSICDKEIDSDFHDYNDNYVCSDCNHACTHSGGFGSGECIFCGKECPHNGGTTASDISGDDNEHTNVCKMCENDFGSSPHSYNDGVCSDCNHHCSHESYAGGICTTCGKSCTHSGGTQKIDKGDDESHDRICSVCDEEISSEEHTYVTSGNVKKCSGCNHVCSHSEGFGSGHCQFCNTPCSHSNWKWESDSDGHNKVCDACDADFDEADHDWSNHDGYCKICEFECEHKVWDEGICEECGLECEHNSWWEGKCNTCGYNCPHNDWGWHEEGPADEHCKQCDDCGYCYEFNEHTWSNCVCTVCNCECEHEDYKWIKTELQHKKDCDYCDYVGIEENHDFNDNTCTVCNYVKKINILIEENVNNPKTYNGSSQQYDIYGTNSDLVFKIEYYVDGAWTTTAPANVGAYNIKITRSEDDTYKAYSKEILNGLIIIKAKISLPTANNNLVYTGNDIEGVSIPENAVYTIIHNKKIDAGNYTAVVSLSNIDNYEWDISAPTSDNQNISWSISKAKVSEPIVLGIYTYTGNKQTADISGVESYMSTSSSLEETNAGTYTLTYTFTNNNYEWNEGSDGVVSWIISKAQGAITVDVTPIEKAYGDTITIPEAISNFGDVICDKEATDLVNVGTYTIIYSLIGTDNYLGDTKSISVTISKKALNVPTLTGTYTYNNNEQTVTINDFDSNVMMYANDSVSKATNVGTYKVKVNLKDLLNYEWSDTFNGELEWNIVKAKVDEPIITTNSFIYDGTEKEVTLNSVESYMTKSNDSIVKATSKGTYTITYTLDSNHEWNTGSDGIITWEITKAQAVITNANDIEIIQGELIVPTATSNFGTVLNNINLINNNVPGNYTLTYKVESTSNFDGATKSVNVKVKANKIVNKRNDITQVEVSTNNGFDPSIRLSLTIINEADAITDILSILKNISSDTISSLKNNENVGLIYDIKLIEINGDNEQEVQPKDGEEVTVKILIPDYIDVNKLTRIIHIHSEQDIEEIIFDNKNIDENGYYTIEVSKFSKFVFIYEANTSELLTVLLIVFGSLIIIFVSFFFIWKIEYDNCLNSGLSKERKLEFLDALFMPINKLLVKKQTE